MRKCEIVKSVSQQTGVDRTDVELIIQATLNAIRKNVSEGQTIHFRGFGSFAPKKRGPKKAQIIHQKKTIVIPAHQVPHFKPSKNYFKIKEAHV